jgi:predicted RNase H-like HicB family nuclease/DNA-binding XRE family transcriptional regulator
MHYDAFIRWEGKHVLAEFPDCPGCQTFAGSADDLRSAAEEALEGWLEAHLVGGKTPPRPVARTRAPSGAKLARVPVRAGLTAAIEIRWARVAAGLSQTQLGELAKVSQQQIAKLESPDENPTLETIEKVARALGLAVSVDLERAAPISVPPRRAAAAR